ncbi:MAG: protein translocase subunit SecF, partial [Deltaproteobacteria bacterium]|nr:protein translocase subunit SecF [Deltaproteobacteria bacterium]
MLGFKGFHFNFISKMRLFMAVSLIAILGSLYLMSTRGLNFGTDFKGGIRLQYRFQSAVTEGDLRKLLERVDLGDFSVQKAGRAEENRIVVKIERQEDLENLSQKIADVFRANLKGTGFVLEQEESVGPKAGADLRKKGILAILISWLLMLIYVGYRFDFAFAPGAIIALVHDVLVTLGAFAVSGREVSLTVVAALMTITGYSINDTIVIYDRIRENSKKYEKLPLREMINQSINETLSRTIITNLTVLLVVVLIYLFGEGEFQSFGFAMVIGAISGT